MNDHELKVKRCQLDVKDSESRLREVKLNLENGYKKSAAALERAKIAYEEAKAVHEQEYNKLKEEVARAENHLEREKAYLLHAEAEKERGFQA